MDPNHSETKNNLKEVWEMRIADNRNIYPASFNGSWIYTKPAAYIPGSTRDEIYYENESYDRIIKQGTFFYTGETIELDDGKILLFRKNTIKDDEKIFTRQ